MPKEKDEITKEEMERLLEMSEASILVHDYDYIFSDFDPRPYHQRSISDDFLTAAKKATYMKSENDLDFRFIVPKDKRDKGTEETVKKRLHEYFRKHHHVLELEIGQIRKKGVVLTLIGFSLMVIAAFVHTLDPKPFALNFFIVILEPAGWFATWFGLDQIFYNAAQKKDDLQFYSKMVKSKISFNEF